jgi:hypothetical protein
MRWENRDPSWLVAWHPWFLLAFAIGLYGILRFA